MKTLRWILLVLLGLLALGYFIGIPYLREQTKKHSPEVSAGYQQNGLDLQVTYSSPSKKGREIFGALVPYGQVWRTGANEPTTFRTGSDIEFGGQPLGEGLYSLWTIPEATQWTVILNKEVPDWGVTLTSMGRETARDPASDILQVVVPVRDSQVPREKFGIDFVEEQGQLYIQLSWDTVQVRAPINR